MIPLGTVVQTVLPRPIPPPPPLINVAQRPEPLNLLQVVVATLNNVRTRPHAACVAPPATHSDDCVFARGNFHLTHAAKHAVQFPYGGSPLLPLLPNFLWLPDDQVGGARNNKRDDDAAPSEESAKGVS